MVFQDPMSSLNPVYTVGFQISEALMPHKGMNKTQARERALNCSTGRYPRKQKTG